MGQRGQRRTPGNLPERESCIRTLIVSRGWQHNWKHSDHRIRLLMLHGFGRVGCHEVYVQLP